MRGFKMRLLFAHDHKLHKYNDEYYSNGSFSSEALKRYTSIFDSVTFISRHVLVDERPMNMSLANTERLDFKQIPDFKSIKTYYRKKEALNIIEDQVKSTDYVISRLPSDVGFIAIEYAKKYKKPYLIEVVTCPWDSLWNHSMLGKVLAPIRFLKLKRVVKSAPYVIYVTSYFLQKRYPTYGENTNCSNVALTEFDDKVLEKRFKKIRNTKTNSKIVIGTTAAVNVRFKGQQYIIQALGKLKRQGLTNYEYQLVGGGNQNYLKSVAEKYDVLDQVKFLGAMPHDKVFEWLETIDIYAQPSRQEGLPRALIEAMSRAVPAFGARTAGIPELLEDDFIFSNTKKNLNEICEILKFFNKETMTKQAKRNYEESKKYDKNVIEQRRRDFFKKFRKQNE